jgi:hypothetical protein
MKVLVGADDRILGFTMIGSEAGEVMCAVQTAMLAKLPYPQLRDAVIAHLTMAEGLGLLIIVILIRFDENKSRSTFDAPFRPCAISRSGVSATGPDICLLPVAGRRCNPPPLRYLARPYSIRTFRTRSTVFFAPIFVIRLVRWNSTVRGLMSSARAVSLLEAPRTIWANTARSRRVSNS